MRSGSACVSGAEPPLQAPPWPLYNIVNHLASWLPRLHARLLPPHMHIGETAGRRQRVMPLPWPAGNAPATCPASAACLPAPGAADSLCFEMGLFRRPWLLQPCWQPALPTPRRSMC